jgi:dienelactone hydrolase
MDEQHRRTEVRRISWWSVGCAVVFTTFAVGTTQLRTLRAHSPWQDDPYDVAVSFTQLLVPALAVALAVRIIIRRPGAAPGDLLRAGRALVGMVAVTAATDWVAVGLRVHEDAWERTGRLLIAALALVTLVTVAVAARMWWTTRQAGERAQVQAEPEGPDWVDDVVAGAGDLAGQHGGPAGRAVARALDWIRRVLVGGRHGLRRHRLAAAVLVAVVVSAWLTLAEARGDGLGPHPAAAAAMRVVIGAAGLVAALIPLNAYLGVLRPAGPARSAATRRPALTCAGYAAVASVPVAVGFRDEIAAMADFPITSWGRLAGLTAVLAALTGLITLLAQATRRRRHRWAKALLLMPLAVLLALVGTVGYLGVRHEQPRSLPAPTGPYSVGRTAFDWTDTGRTDPLAPQPGQDRELSVWVWYPAPAGISGQPALYAPGHWARMLSFGILANRLDAVRTHSVADASVAAGRYPLLILEPGMGLAAPQFTALAEDLASHGYVVAGVTPTYSANITVLHGQTVGPTPAGNPQDTDQANGNRLVRVWAADARYVAGRIADTRGPLAGHVDASRVTYIGHSFGGAASLQACHDDPRCAGAVDMDGTPYGTVVRQGLTAPMMLLGTPGDCLAGACHPTDAVQTDIDTASRALRTASTGPTFRYEIAGAKHFNFTDYGAYYIPTPLHGLTQLGSIDGHRCLTIVSAYVTAFADHVLHGGAEPQPDRRYPEVRTAS